VVFHPLSRDQLTEVVDFQLKRVSRLLADKGYILDVSQAAKEFLADEGYDPAFGARPLKRAIQRELQDPLAMKILASEFREGDVIEVDRGKDGLVFTTAVQGEVVEA
jgi:ATP-dependent Clp protease ATP-binding subunit ClpB